MDVNQFNLKRIYLEENFVNGVNILTQDMLLYENACYIIPYVFDLNNETICIPSNSFIKFEGGMLKNGILLGETLNDIYYPEFFGAVGDGVTNDSRAIQNCIHLIAKGGTIKFTGNYLLNDILINKNLTFEGNKKSKILAVKQNGCVNVSKNIFTSIEEVEEITFKNLYFNGDYYTDRINNMEGQPVSNIYIENCLHVNIEGCTITKFTASMIPLNVIQIKDWTYKSVFCIKNYDTVNIIDNTITDNPDKEVIYCISKNEFGKVNFMRNRCYNNFRSYTSIYIYDGRAYIANNQIGETKTSAIGCIAKNSIIENNFLYHIKRRGINCQESRLHADNTIIRNNIITNDGYLDTSEIESYVEGINIVGSNIKIEGNIINGVYTGISCWEDLVQTNQEEGDWLSTYENMYNLDIVNNTITAIGNPIKGRQRTMQQTGYEHDIRYYNVTVANNTLEVINPTSEIAGSCIYFDNVENFTIHNNRFLNWGDKQGGNRTSNPGAINSEYYIKNIRITNNYFSNIKPVYFSFMDSIQAYKLISEIVVRGNDNNFPQESVLIRLRPILPEVDSFIIYDDSLASNWLAGSPVIVRLCVNGVWNK